MKSGIFTEFQRGLPETVVKKSKSFNQNNYVRERDRQSMMQQQLGNEGAQDVAMVDEIDFFHRPEM